MEIDTGGERRRNMYCVDKRLYTFLSPYRHSQILDLSFCLIIHQTWYYRAEAMSNCGQLSSYEVLLYPVLFRKIATSALLIIRCCDEDRYSLTIMLSFREKCPLQDLAEDILV